MLHTAAEGETSTEDNKGGGVLRRVTWGGWCLRHSCLRFVKANMAAVVQRPDFASLAPALLVKSSMFCAGVGAAASGKRKRGVE